MLAFGANENRHFRTGFLKTVPVVIGVVPFGLAYGIVAVQGGLSVGETMLMSLIVFAGASQFMAAGMFQAGVGGPMIVFSTLLMNLRHLVMGLSLSPYLSRETPRWRRVLAFGMTDESYLVSVTHFREQAEPHGSPHFMLASAFLMYVVWNASTLLGALAGHSISNPLAWGLDFAMPATFLTLLLPQVINFRLLVITVVAGAAATASYLLIPGKWYILIAVAAGMGCGLLLEGRGESPAGGEPQSDGITPSGGDSRPRADAQPRTDPQPSGGAPDCEAAL